MCGDADIAELVHRLCDDDLLSLMTDASAARDAVDVILAAAAAEVAHRSAREMGYAGLAQRKGHRNVTSLVQNITGQTRADVGRAIRAGEELVPSEPSSSTVADDVPTPDVPRWLRLLRGRGEAALRCRSGAGDLRQRGKTP